MRYPVILALAAAVGLVACGKKEEATAPEQAPAAMAPAPAAAATPVDAATQFKTVCATCHGPNGQGLAAYPKLAGLSADVAKAKLTDYKAGKQMGPQTTVMAPIAAKLSDSDIDALAQYVTTLK
jgi:cytochrome c553